MLVAKAHDVCHSQVTQVKTFASNGYNGLQLGCGSKRDKQVNGSLRGQFQAAGVPVKRKVAEFRVSQVLHHECFSLQGSSSVCKLFKFSMTLQTLKCQRGFG